MHDALSYPRVHPPKTRISGTFDPRQGQTFVDNPKGQHFRTMGAADKQGRLSLLPEEALYLVERGNLDLRFADNVCELPYRNHAGMPMSLQAAYTHLMIRGLTLERYSVYAGLKRSGYIVRRGPAWLPEDWDKDVVEPKTPEDSTAPSFFEWLRKVVFDGRTTPPSLGPLVGPGLYRSYRKIYIPCRFL